ncbi:MAG: ATP-dependent RNA helicase DbpA [Nitrospira sp.]|nr:ATP-dependent RNA helicase DbpA [Nitrospira sp.]
MTDPSRSFGGQDWLLPYQRGLVTDLLDSVPGRVLVVWPPGAGIVSALVATCKQWLEMDPEARILIVTPVAVLRDQWLSRLRDVGLPFVSIAAADYRRLEVDTSAADNPWSSVACAVTTIDVLRETRRLGAVIQVHWDFVVIDECHLPGPGTMGASAIERLWDESSIGLVVASTATPSAILTFASPGNSGAPFRLVALNSEEMVVTVAPRVSARVVKFTPIEHTLFEGVRVLLDGVGEEKLDSYFISELRRRASSSLRTLETSLRSLLVSAESGTNAVAEDGGDFVPDEELGDSPATPTDEPVGIEQLQDLVDLISEVDVDSKAEALTTLLASELPDGLVVVFSDFADTVTYLVQHLEGAGRAIHSLTRESTPEERDATIRAFKSGTGIVIASTSAAEGVDFGDASATIHYDLPRYAQGMVLRMSRVDRIGRALGPSIALVDEVSLDPEQLDRLRVILPDKPERH